MFDQQMMASVASDLRRPLWDPRELCDEGRLCDRRSRTTRGRELVTSNTRVRRGSAGQTVGALTSVEEAELAVERPQHLPVPRSIMGPEGSLEVSAPHRWTSRTHLVGNQLVHACNTRDRQSQLASDALLCSVGAGLTTLLWRLLQMDPGNQIGHLVVLRGQHWKRLGDVL